MDAGYDEVEERRRWSTSTNFDSVDWLGKINVDLVDNAIKNLFDVQVKFTDANRRYFVYQWMLM